MPCINIYGNWTKVQLRKVGGNELIFAIAGQDHTPWIRLCGHWLETAGFALHKRVDVHVAHGCVVLIPKGDD